MDDLQFRSASEWALTPAREQGITLHAAEPRGACVTYNRELRSNSIYAVARLLANSGSNRVPLFSMAQATLRSRSMTERRARAWLWPLALRASYLARLVASC